MVDMATKHIKTYYEKLDTAKLHAAEEEIDDPTEKQIIRDEIIRRMM